jgi:molybdopterin/thiamine biosynthesis adenylyltransferase
METCSEKISRRNFPIISSEIQKKIFTTKVLIAGCGLGSLIAESLTRMGFKHFTLIDNDTIESHNLNRQAYKWEDIGTNKVTALKKNLLAINPEVEVITYSEFLTEHNVQKIAPDIDLIVDTIDFLDLKAIVHLHDTALTYAKPIISVFAAGWGALGLFIPASKRHQSFIRDIFEITEPNLNLISYTDKFAKYFMKLGPHLNPEVQEIMIKVLSNMKDNKPCPASVIISGAQLAAIITAKFITNHLSEISMTSAPDCIYLDLNKLINESILKID